MSHTFLWHDYETFGIDTRRDRPAQFASVRTDAQLNQRLAQTQSSYNRYLTDPMLRQAQSSAQLVQVVKREAAVMAFNDVFRAIGAMALSFLAWAFYNWLRLRFLAWRARRASANTSPSPSSPPASPAAR